MRKNYRDYFHSYDLMLLRLSFLASNSVNQYDAGLFQLDLGEVSYHSLP